jgi:hypothetical protein
MEPYPDELARDLLKEAGIERINLRTDPTCGI